MRCTDREQPPSLPYVTHRRFAGILFGVTDVIVGFHAQQGVGKSIKAVLAARGVNFPFTPLLRSIVWG